MADQPNPFDDGDPHSAAIAYQPPPAANENNPFNEGWPDAALPSSSAVGAFARSAERGVLPALGTWAAAGVGAQAGAAVGALGGPFGSAAGALIGGIAGGVGGGFATDKAQDYALSKAPDSWKEAIGQDDRQQKLDAEQHPYASLLGGLSAYTLTLRPSFGAVPPALLENATALQRIMANPVTARVFGGAITGGMELGQEAAGGEPPDWAKVGIATGFGLIFNKPTRLGEAITELGARPFRSTPVESAAAAPREEAPTVAQAGDLGVMGTGLTEETYMGAEEPPPAAKAVAQQTARIEQDIYGKPFADVDLTARKSEPELFANYDALSAQRDAFRAQIDRLSNPPDEDVSAAQSRAADLQAQLDAHIEDRGGYTGGPEARRLRAQVRDAQAASEELLARRQSYETGEGQETPELAALRKQFQDVDFQLRDMGREVAAARRRAAEATGTETVPANELPAEPVVPIAAPIAQEPATTIDQRTPQQQRDFIEGDVRQNLIAVGRSPEEAEASAKLTSALYETHAARLGGAGGTAEEIYRREAPEIKAGRERARQPEMAQGARGKLRITDGRSVMTLMHDANASTYVHEVGHDWLERLTRDGDSLFATPSLKADVTAIRKWLGAPEGPIKTRQHEKFARGFEQYLREGVAPSARLAGVFAKFRNWLMTIYQTIKGLGAPINEDIRGVFDRMLSTEPQRTVISPERPSGPTLPEIHEADARLTEPAEKGFAADRVAAERARAAAEPPPEVEHELAPILAEIEAQSETAAGGEGAQPGGEAGSGGLGRPEVERGGGQAGAEPGSGGMGVGHGPERAGGSRSAEGGSGVSGGGEGERTAGPKSHPLASTPAEQFSPRDERIIDKAGNIRVENLTNVEEIAKAIHDSADRNDEFKAVRGSMTKGQMSDLADEMGLDPSRIKEATLARLLGGTENLGAKILAARKLVVDSARIVADLMNKAADSDSPEDMASFAQAVARHDMIQSALAGVTAEWGRAGSAFHSLMQGWDKAQDINQFLKDNTGRDLFQLKRMAKLGKNLDTPGKVSKFLRDVQSRSGGRMILEYWVNALISGLPTHITYIIGNEALLINKMGIETPTAALIGKIRESFGREGERVFAGEAMSGSIEHFRALPKAITAAVEALRSGQTTLLPGETGRPLLPFAGDVTLSPQLAKTVTNADVTWKEAKADTFGLFSGMKDGIAATAALVKAGGEEGAPIVGLKYSPLGHIPGIAYRGVEVLPVGHIARGPSRFVAAIHSFFRTMNYSIENSAKAWRQASSEGLEGTAFNARVADLRQNPSEASMEQSRGISNELTLMGAGGEVVKHMSAIMNWAPKLPLLGETPVLKFIDPFVHIAANIIDQTIVHRTPVGLLSSEIRADLLGHNGNVAQDMAQARMLVGSTLAMTFGGLAAQGMMTGSGPTDPNKAAMWRMAGNQAHSIRIGDVWYDVHRLGPLGMLSGIAADMYDVAHAASSGDLLTAGSMLMHGFVQNVLDESFMRGPSEWLNAITDPARYGPRMIQNFAASFVPYSVGLSQIDRATDPYSRRARSVMDAIKQKVPGISEELFPNRDIWGEPMPNHSALVASGLTAIYESRISQDPVNTALAGLGIGFAPVPQSIRNVKLDEQQYDDFSRLSGRMAKMRLDAIIRSPDWSMWPAHIQRDVATEVVKQSRESARGVMMMKYPSIPAQAAKNKQTKEED